MKMKSTVAGLLGAFVVGLVAGGVGTYFIVEHWPSQTVQVVIAGRDFPAGTVLESRYLGAGKYTRKSVPDDHILWSQERGGLPGRVLTVAMKQGEVIGKRHLAEYP